MQQGKKVKREKQQIMQLTDHKNSKHQQIHTQKSPKKITKTQLIINQNPPQNQNFKQIKQKPRSSFSKIPYKIHQTQNFKQIKAKPTNLCSYISWEAQL